MSNKRKSIGEGRVEPVDIDPRSYLSEFHFCPEKCNQDELFQNSCDMLVRFLPGVLKPEFTLSSPRTLKRTQSVIKAPPDAVDAMKELVREIQKNYNDIIYHSFAHAVDVTQMMFMLVLEHGEDWTDKEKFFMVLTALCHDLGHFGVGNAFIRDNLAKWKFVNNYSFQCNKECKVTIMEKYHLEEAIKLIEKNAFFSRKEIQENLIPEFTVWCTSLILSTDLGNQKFFLEYVKAGKRYHPRADDKVLGAIDPPDAKALLYMKISDMCNVFRQFSTAKDWTIRILLEQEAGRLMKEELEKSGWRSSMSAQDVLKIYSRCEKRANVADESGVPDRMKKFAVKFVYPMLQELSTIDKGAYKKLIVALKESLEPSSASVKDSGFLQFLSKKLSEFEKL